MQVRRDEGSFLEREARVKAARRVNQPGARQSRAADCGNRLLQGVFVQGRISLTTERARARGLVARLTTQRLTGYKSARNSGRLEIANDTLPGLHAVPCLC